jgi:hypothetical protein
MKGGVELRKRRGGRSGVGFLELTFVAHAGRLFMISKRSSASYSHGSKKPPRARGQTPPFPMRQL